MNLKGIFEEAGFHGSWLSFKAPTAEERQHHWLKRYADKAPADGHVFLADRTFLGDYAYNPSATPERMMEMAADVKAVAARSRGQRRAPREAPVRSAHRGQSRARDGRRHPVDRFRAFAEATDDSSSLQGTWERVGTKDRHAGRVHAYEALIARLEKLAS
jgi:hypothetical protein